MGDRAVAGSVFQRRALLAEDLSQGRRCVSGSPRPFFRGRTSGPQELWPQGTWSEPVSGARVPAFILSAGASASESHHQTQETCCYVWWEELERLVCTFTHVLSITGLAKGFLGYWNGGRAGFNFQVRQTAAGGEHVALSGAVSGQDGEFSVYRLVGKREITFSEERIILCFRILMAALTRAIDLFSLQSVLCENN